MDPGEGVAAEGFLHHLMVVVDASESFSGSCATGDPTQRVSVVIESGHTGRRCLYDVKRDSLSWRSGCLASDEG